MKKFSVCLLALFVLSFILLPMVAFADTVDVTLTGTGGESDGTYYIAPYLLSINNAAPVNAFCVDFYHESHIPQNWTANVTPVISGGGWNDTYQYQKGAPNYSETYAAMAYLASIYGSAPDLQTRINIQHAIWDLSFGNPIGTTTGMPYQDAGALTFVASGWGNYNTIFTTNTGWVVLTDIKGINGGTQEFLTQGPVATPEPGTIMLLGSGILGVYGFSRKKRTQLKT